MLQTLLLLLLSVVAAHFAVTGGNKLSVDKDSFQAIKELHAELDDDHNGKVNEAESADYMKEKELTDTETKHDQMFSDDEDKDHQISVDELWHKWKRSKVYSWSVEEAIYWLRHTVNLPEYSKVFRKKKVSGKTIPRLATPHDTFLQKDLKITNIQHRRKIYIRASDLILYGVPSDFKPLQSDKSFMAIRAVHQHLDDDSDGSIDAGESQEYLDEELEASSSKRHLSLHTHDDQVSVDELWENWQESEVYSWTTDQVVDWLKNIVGLPQYEKKFRDKKINGKCIPRIATDKSSFLQAELGVKNPRHRRKIYLRASDIILYGSPEKLSNLYKDLVVAVIVVFSTLLCVYALHEKRVSKKQIENMSKDLVALQQAEDNLKALQETLAEPDNLNGESSSEREKILLEEIELAKKEAERLHVERSTSQKEKMKLALVEQELSEVRLALAKAELEMKGNQTQPPKALQEWLKKTYHIESEYFKLRKDIAMTQMTEAREATDRVSKARKSMFGSLRLAHGQTIDVVEQKIINARTALSEVTSMLQERQHRWSEIEELCNFTLVTDSLYANKPKKTRRSSLQQALADVSSLTFSGPVSGTISEDIMGEIKESACVSNFHRSSFDAVRKSSRDNSFDSSEAVGSGSGGSSTGSRQASIISNVSSTANQDCSDTQSLKEKNEQPQRRVTVNGAVAPKPPMRRVSSERFVQSSPESNSSRPPEKKLFRVNTEPVGMSRRAMTNALNSDRQRNSGEFHRSSAHINADSPLKDQVSDSPNALFTTQSEEDISSSIDYSLNNFDDENCDDDGEDDGEDDDISLRTTATTGNGNLSDGSMTSSASATSSKKKKKGIQGLKKIFYRKQKEDR